MSDINLVLAILDVILISGAIYTSFKLAWYATTWLSRIWLVLGGVVMGLCLVLVGFAFFPSVARPPREVSGVLAALILAYMLSLLIYIEEAGRSGRIFKQ